MRTYTLFGLYDFILFIIDQEQEETLWELWLAKDIKDDFKTFKRTRMKAIRKKKAVTLTPAQEKEIIGKNSRFIKPREGGENE